MTPFDETLNYLGQGAVLSEKEMEFAMRQIMSGEVNDTDLASFLTNSKSLIPIS